MFNRFSATFLVLLLLFVGTARGQTQEEREAFRLYKEAQSDIEASRFMEALEKLERAYKLFPMPHILVRKAEALRGLGELEQALEVLRNIQGADQKLKMKIAELMVAIKRELQETVTVEIKTNVPGVEVIVDQVEKHIAPCSIRLTRGYHQFELKKDGYETVLLERTISGPESRIIEVSMREKRGRVIFATDLPSFDGVVIRVGDMEMLPKGRPGEPNKTDPIELKAGTYSFWCVREGQMPYTGNFSVEPGQTTVATCLLKPPPSGPSRKTWGYVTLGTGAAMVATGTTLVAWYYAKKARQPGDDPQGNRYVFRDYHENVIGFALLGVGIASAVASYFLLSSASASAERHAAEGNLAMYFGMLPTNRGAVATGGFTF